jgi:nucleoid DNA-binding protein
MNRTELIDFISDKSGLTKAASSSALEAVVAAITASLKKGVPVVLLNFGTFTLNERAAREGRNPSTGEKIKIKAAKVVRFKAGKALKEAVKEDQK